VNLRLTLATLFLRGRLQTRWLQAIDDQVSKGLLHLLEGAGPGLVDEGVTRSHRPADYRRQMSAWHAKLVDALVAQRGLEEGSQEGRRIMYETGLMLGRDLRRRLRLSDDAQELMAAARLLYRILGIEFQADLDETGGRMTVVRCSLSQHYTPLTCEVISAMDEGVVSGLNPSMSMRFDVRNRPVSPCCTAELRWEGSE
jgi:hypothetical protein